MKKKMIAIFMASVLLLSGVKTPFAQTVATNYDRTTGGTNGYVYIDGEITYNHSTPTSGVNIYAYQVSAKIRGITTITTNIHLWGSFNALTYSDTFDSTLNANKVWEAKTKSAKTYLNCQSRCQTYSTAFGSSDFICNGNFE